MASSLLLKIVEEVLCGEKDENEKERDERRECPLECRLHLSLPPKGPTARWTKEAVERLDAFREALYIACSYEKEPDLAKTHVVLWLLVDAVGRHGILDNERVPEALLWLSLASTRLGLSYLLSPFRIKKLWMALAELSPTFYFSLYSKDALERLFECTGVDLRAAAVEEYGEKWEKISLYHRTFVVKKIPKTT